MEQRAESEALLRLSRVVTEEERSSTEALLRLSLRLQLSERRVKLEHRKCKCKNAKMQKPEQREPSEVCLRMAESRQF